MTANSCQIISPLSYKDIPHGVDELSRQWIISAGHLVDGFGRLKVILAGAITFLIRVLLRNNITHATSISLWQSTGGIWIKHPYVFSALSVSSSVKSHRPGLGVSSILMMINTISLLPTTLLRVLLVTASSIHGLHLGLRRDARAFN